MAELVDALGSGPSEHLSSWRFESSLAHYKPDRVSPIPTVYWTLRENVRARLRVLARRTLRKYHYPPDKQERATQTVLQQAEVLSEAWAA